MFVVPPDWGTSDVACHFEEARCHVCTPQSNLRNIGGMAKHSNDILAWARRGAEVRWNELHAEVASLLKAFPDLATISNTARRTIAKSARGVADTIEPKRQRSKMSAA